MSDVEDRIRCLAHQIWVEDGMPAGQEAEHWFKAADIVRRENFEETMASADPNPAIEAEDFDGVVNPDPAARHSDEPAAQRAVHDRQDAKAAAAGPIATLAPPRSRDRRPQAGSSVADK